MKKLFSVGMSLVMVCGLAACSPETHRSMSPSGDKSATLAEKIVKAHVPYVEGGGSPYGATSGSGSQPGFDQAGLITYVFADCCSMLVGFNIQEIYDKSSEPGWGETEEKTPVKGDLVFNKDKTKVGIITEYEDGKGMMVIADPDTSSIEEIEWNQEEFPEIREMKNGIDNNLRVDLRRWEDENKEDQTPYSPNDFSDPNDKSSSQEEFTGGK